MADMVCSALVQEVVSRGSSSWFSKREEKASQGHIMERLEMAVSDLEFAFERSAKLPITDVSLLHKRQKLKRAYLEGTDLLNKHKRQAVQGQELETGKGVIKRCKRWIIPAKSLSIISSCAGLNTEDVRRFEWFADCAGKFLRDVESGCSLRHYTFCNPLVRHLLEGKILMYQMVQGSQERRFYMWPVCSEGRGVETLLEYHYVDLKVPEKSFWLALLLRLSENTEIDGTAIKCLRPLLVPQLKLVTETAMGELTLLANLQYVSHSHAPTWAEIDEEWRTENSQYWRPDPVCCKEDGHGPCASDIDSSELSSICPEQVILFCFKCNISAEYSLRSSSDHEVGRSAMRGRRSPLELTVGFAPHMVNNEEQESCALEKIGDSEARRRNVSIQQMAETVRSFAISCLLRQPELKKYAMKWMPRHGTAIFKVERPSTERAGAPKTSGGSRTQRSAKRRR